MHFASDNAGPAAPEILEAVARANRGYARGYGADALTARAAASLREMLEAPEAAVFFVGAGSAANALALACLCPPWSAIFCHRLSHVEEDECGAPEFYTGGAKLALVEGEHARMDPDALRAAIAYTGRTTPHNVRRGALSLTQATEMGAVYPPDRVRELTAIAREAGVPVHMDGARFANAVARLGCSPAEASWKAGVDILTFGVTKNGGLGAEAVVIFDPARAAEFEFRRKRGGHLFSKMRFVAAQVEAALADGLWLRLAARANAAADRLAARLAEAGGCELLQPVEANMVFVGLDRARYDRAVAAGAEMNPWPHGWRRGTAEDGRLSVRLVCNWATTDAEIDAFMAALGD